MENTTSQKPSTLGPATDTPRIGYEVLICTYNGADYITEQLESILRQQPAPKRVLVSDDGSTDDTRAIVNQIADSSAIPVSIIDGPGKGVIVNVLTALPQTSAEYVFLADQDDIWLENKAALFCERMGDHKQPHLIFSDAWVWHPGEEAMESFWKLDGLNPKNANDPRKLAFHNTVQGASACVNRALIDQVHAAGIPTDLMMHDWWLTLVASTLGTVDSISEPTLLYRQHNNNQVGSQNKAGRKRRNFSHRRAVATRILRQAATFVDHYERKIPKSQRSFFCCYRWAIRGNILKRAWFILRFWPKHRDLRHTITLWASIGLAKGTAKA